MGPKPQVVVLGAVESAPAFERPEDAVPHHDARVNEGRLDQEVGDDRVVVEKRVRPLHVRAHARRGPRVHRHAAAEHVDRGVFVEATRLSFEAILTRDVVCVHACHEGSARGGEAQVERRHESAGGARQHPDPGVRAGPCLQEGEARVRRSVVDGDDLVLAQGLGAQGKEARLEGRGRVADGQENRDPRDQRCRATNSRAAFKAASAETPSTTK